MRLSNRRSSVTSHAHSSWLSIRWLLPIFLLFTSLTLNIWLLSPSMNNDDGVPAMYFLMQGSTNSDNNDCDSTETDTDIDIDTKPLITSNNQSKHHDSPNNASPDNVCHFNASLRGKIYVYDIPWHMREIPRYLWYERFSGGDNYNETKSLNFGFGKKMYENDWSRKDFHLTHMHVLEVILNERLKSDKYYITDNPDEAMLFHIPYPFGLHYRYWERLESERIANHHHQLQKWLNEHEAYQKYFVDEKNRRPHILTFGRIAYETVRLEKMGSKFFKIHNGKQVYYCVYDHT